MNLSYMQNIIFVILIKCTNIFKCDIASEYDFKRVFFHDL